jgi:hypothetical protein
MNEIQWFESRVTCFIASQAPLWWIPQTTNSLTLNLLTRRLGPCYDTECEDHVGWPNLPALPSNPTMWWSYDGSCTSGVRLRVSFACSYKPFLKFENRSESASLATAFPVSTNAFAITTQSFINSLIEFIFNLWHERQSSKENRSVSLSSETEARYLQVERVFLEAHVTKNHIQGNSWLSGPSWNHHDFHIPTHLLFGPLFFWGEWVFWSYLSMWFVTENAVYITIRKKIVKIVHDSDKSCYPKPVRQPCENLENGN